MKKLMFAVVMGVACVANAELKVGTVDMLKLVRNHSSYEPNKTLLTETQKDYEKKLDKMKSDVDDIQVEFTKKSDQIRQPMLSEAAKQKIEKELIEIQNRGLAGQQRLRNEAMRSQQDLAELEARLLKATSADLKKKIAAFAEENGYDMIIDSTAATYSKADLDVTAGVLKSMGVDPEKAIDPAAEEDAPKSRATPGEEPAPNPKAATPTDEGK